MIEMFETGSGGDYVAVETGLRLDNSFKTIGFISLFGGNLIDDTEIDEKPAGTIYNDYWGNADTIGDSTQYMNSIFERVISTLPINSSNLINYESAAEDDLNFLVELGYVESVEATGSIIGIGKLRMDIVFNQPSSTENETLSFIWDETLKRIELLSA